MSTSHAFTISSGTA
uniref:Omega-6 fatty acid desaturase, endoplasmic reticulum isozyme 2 n=1 Tax=Arundo donax TaxID=35708 RepID=A0A0A8Z3K7_ARUDO